ncbi:MAG TPA: hypothetical protein VLS51_06685 [Propionibacteriaceae bacterium]|nr:hypothetical protein [Propionibacteriaceae bacterium]
MDNATLATAADQHPCFGIGEDGIHAVVDGRCVDCGYEPPND